MRWSENLFRQEVDTSVFSIQSWADFEQQFQSQFFPVSMEADAVNTLEGFSYYQGNWTVGDYLDNFLTLVLDAGYTDPQTLVVKFHQGVKDVRSGSGVTRIGAELLWSGRELTTKVGEQPWPQLVRCASICCCMCGCVFQED